MAVYKTSRTHVFAITPEIWAAYKNDPKVMAKAKELEAAGIYFQFIDYNKAKSEANEYWNEIKIENENGGNEVPKGDIDSSNDDTD